MKITNIKSLYYITHIENLPSILQQGILSHKKVEELEIAYKPIYDSGIVSKRKDKSTLERNSLWEYANLYFQPRNPMVYRVVHDKEKRDIAIVGVKPEVLKIDVGIVTDGNAANDPTQFFSVKEGLKILANQWKIIQNECFATKRHWRQNSSLEDIEGGLDWVKNNYNAMGITSLAMPALGCGLGKLSWAGVRPLMCRYLHDIDIQVAIYLPREHLIAPEYLTDDYLLKIDGN